MTGGGDNFAVVTCQWRPGCKNKTIGLRCGVQICRRCETVATDAGATVSVTEVLRQARRDAGMDFAVTYDEGLLQFPHGTSPVAAERRSR